MYVLQDKNQIDTSKKYVLVGNPNVGKSVVFNKLTGIHTKVANFPGITLSYLKGKLKTNSDIDIVDLPGIYSLVSSKMEERMALQYLMQEKPDLIINVMDARKVERNLALTLQLLEFELPMIIVLTHSDKISKGQVNTTQFKALLNIPIFQVNAHLSKDYLDLFEYFKSDFAAMMYNEKNISKLFIPELDVFTDNESMISSGSEIDESQSIDLNQEKSKSTAYNEMTDGDVSLDLNVQLMDNTGHISNISDIPKRLVYLSVLLGGDETIHFFPSFVTDRILHKIETHYPDREDLQDLRLAIIQKFYDEAKDLGNEIVNSDLISTRRKFVSKFDNFLIHPFYGIIFFVLAMYTMFSMTFILTEPIVGLLEDLMTNLANVITSIVSNEFIASFLADGVIGGVGFVLVFIPQIAVLFLIIAFMEHSGYLARAVFLTDRYLEKIGISGTSIAPMLLGFGCNVPGVMATKSISDHNERLVVGLVNPFMSCSARLPVYVIISSAIFPNYVGLVVTSLYFIGIVIAVSVMYILRKTILPGESQYLILEIPDLQLPKLESMLNEAYRHSRKFIANAASWMALGLIVMWFLSITGPSGYLGPEALSSSELVSKSWIFFIGDILSPIFVPLNWDPRLVVALVMGFIAKEIVIGSLGLLYGIGDASLSSVIALTLDPISAYAFLVFVLIYTPCIGTYFTMRSQLGKKWANFSVVSSLVLAYVLALSIVIIGNLLI